MSMKDRKRKSAIIVPPKVVVVDHSHVSDTPCLSINEVEDSPFTTPDEYVGFFDHRYRQKADHIEEKRLGEVGREET